jgi:sugar phosphate isomerase/epimerase
MADHKIPIALQLYSVRGDCAQDLLGTLAKVAKMGYEGVEFAGFFEHSAKDVRKALDDNGLKVAGTHTGVDALSPEKLEATLAFHAEIGCKNIVIPWLPEAMRLTPEACKETGAKLSEISAALNAKGFATGFHAHHADMQPLSDGVSAWYHIARTTPEAFIMQYDTANGMSGGADPVKPILDFPKRSITLHLKEWAGAHGEALIGDGQVPWAKVFEAAETVGGTQWYIVEHEDENLMPPIEAVEKCLLNLRKMGK